MRSDALEGAVADFMHLTRAVGERLGNTECEVRVGIEWSGADPLIICTTDQFGYPLVESAVPLARFTPISVLVDLRADDVAFRRDAHRLALDCVNQGGVETVRHLLDPQGEQ